MRKTTAATLAGLVLAGGLVAGTGSSAAAGPAAPCPPPPPKTTSGKAFDKKSRYKVPNRKIYLRIGKVNYDTPCGTYWGRYGWAMAKGYKGMYVRLEVDTTGNKKADEVYTKKKTSNGDHWTIKRSYKGAKHMRACVVSSSGTNCSNGYTTSWWPVGT